MMMMSRDNIIELSHQYPIMVYDGVCILCNGYVKWLLRHDTKERFRYITMQSVPQLYAQLPSDDSDTVLLITDGQVYTHSDVALTMMRKLGGLWPILSVLLLVPRFLRDGVYRIIAAHRYRWFGKSDTCLLPDPSKQHLFLDQSV